MEKEWHLGVRGQGLISVWGSQDLILATLASGEQIQGGHPHSIAPALSSGRQVATHKTKTESSLGLERKPNEELHSLSL